MVAYRNAESSDALAVMEFWAGAAEDSHRPPDSADAVLRLIDRDPQALILAVDNDVVVGSIIVGWDGWRCHLYRLAVAPSHRRQGIGRELVVWVEVCFASYGGMWADAMVFDDNEPAHWVWSTAGCAPQPEWSRWVKPL